MSMRAMQQPVRKDQQRSMRWVFNPYQIDEMTIHRQRVYTFSPSTVNPQRHVVYFHGGAYVWQGDYIHWFFVRHLMRQLDCRVSYVDYPLAPENGYQDTFDMIQGAYEHLVRVYADDNFVFMGDSAGGGLALALAQKLNKAKFPVQPQKSILLSPWLDMRLENPHIKNLENQDPILSREALCLAGDLYAKGADKSDYLLSPINGDMEGLGEVHIFSGTRDILWPDCQKLFEISKPLHKRVFLYAYEHLPHIFMFFPFRQSKDAINQIIRVLNM